jgi:thiol-disulfide isomerase/thioredoxin
MTETVRKEPKKCRFFLNGGVLLETLSVGHYAFSAGPLLLFGAILVALGAGEFMKRRSGVNVEPQLWIMLIFGLLAARLAFVAMHFSLYLESPLSVFDVKDGGYSLTAGLVAVVALAALALWRMPHKRKPLGVAAIAGLAAWAAGIAVMTMLAPKPMALPALTFQGLDGNTLTLSELKGRPVVVNLWASWCPPCRKEMPVLRDAQARHKDVVFVFVDQGEDDNTARSYVANQQLALRNVVLDPQRKLASQADSQVLPTTLFFDEKGMLVSRRIGELSTVTLAQRVESLRASMPHSLPPQP